MGIRSTSSIKLIHRSIGDGEIAISGGIAETPENTDFIRNMKLKDFSLFPGHEYAGWHKITKNHPIGPTVLDRMLENSRQVMTVNDIDRSGHSSFNCPGISEDVSLRINKTPDGESVVMSIYNNNRDSLMVLFDAKNGKMFLATQKENPPEAMLQQLQLGLAVMLMKPDIFRKDNHNW